MRLNVVGGVLAAFVLLALILGYGTLFTVHQTRQALVVRLGQPVRVVTAPGLHFKIPCGVDMVTPGVSREALCVRERLYLRSHCVPLDSCLKLDSHAAALAAVVTCGAPSDRYASNQMV